ncbi:MAG: 4-alpha-glucanotransferase [Candidatus Omnitrophica bacterium]|nr:4-alpha-glucanotransferase [Candidatus Omnitrophota bacterium]
MVDNLSKKKWERIGSVRRAGVLAPLFSIYSEDSIGIGDFADLKLLINWTNQAANTIVQLLPLNEVGPLFCPYDSLSSFALEPMYLSLRPFAGKTGDLKKKFPAGKSYVDYGIKKAKLDLLREIYLKEKNLKAPAFQKFQKENTYWLDDFAIFQALKNYHQGRPWYEWEDKYRRRDAAALEDFRQAHKEEIGFVLWLQWQLYEQLRGARAYAREQKVWLKGDLPILVSRDSADVWQHPEFFKLEFAAGAPPDMYAALGQRWGMPTYHWERIAADGYRYLKEKLRYAQNFYDILRIDHVVGLFRIWSIPVNEPLENKGLNGFFDPRDEKEWERHGRQILSVIVNSTDMLIAAEDLGVIPAACPNALEEFGIPGNDVQRWVKEWKIKHDFLGPADYRKLSVAMLSTHDTTNWPAWWENEAGTVDAGLFMRKCGDHRQINFNQVKDKLFDHRRSKHGRLRWLNNVNSVDKLVAILGKNKEELKDFIDLYENSYREKEKLWLQMKLKGPMREKAGSEILKAALKITLDSRAVFCIQSLIDWLYLADIFKGEPYQYRINTPGTISDKNWSLTLPLSLEALLKHRVCKDIRQLITKTRS